jgi:hypothetical protein
MVSSERVRSHSSLLKKGRRCTREGDAAFPSPPSPLSLRERGRQLTESAPDAVENESRLFEDHVVRKAKQGDSLTLEVVVAANVTKWSTDVRLTICFDREASGDAEEVGEVAADGMLSAEFESGELPIPQQGPQVELGGRVVAPKGARAERFASVELGHDRSSTDDGDRLGGIDMSVGRLIF